MYLYAQIDGNGRVVSISQLSSLVESADLVPITTEQLIQLGDVYQNGVFTAAPPAALGTQITRLAFLSRFTDAEAVALDLASIGATVAAATLRRYMDKVNAANFIDLAREDTRAGVQALEAMGVLTEGRASEILDAPVMATEVPQ